jgi:hypothetical protein
MSVSMLSGMQVPLTILIGAATRLVVSRSVSNGRRRFRDPR